MNLFKNPFRKRSYCFWFSLSRNKNIEIQLDWWNFNMFYEWFELIIRNRTKQDHPGFEFTFGFLKIFWLHINFYDSRHWNYEKDRFYFPGEEMAEYENDFPEFTSNY